MITNSMEWNSRRILLEQQIHELPYNRDLRKLLSNIDGMVVELSRAEVIYRRLNKNISELEELKQVNGSIETLEKWILLAALLG